MATVKRAIRRLVRRADGTVGIKYIDLDTLLEVTDLTGYQVLDIGQTTPEPELNDNSADQEVVINPSAGGSSAGGGSGSDRAEYYSNTGPQVNLSQYPPAPVANPQVASPAVDEAVDEEAGGVTVTPDEDVAAAEWDSVPESNQEFTGPVSTDRFGGTPEQAAPKDHPAVSMPGNQEPSQVERDLHMRNELENIKDEGLGPSGLPTMGTKVATRPELPDWASVSTPQFNKDEGLGPSGLYTKAQQNIDIGSTMDYARPQGPAYAFSPETIDRALTGANPSSFSPEDINRALVGKDPSSFTPENIDRSITGANPSSFSPENINRSITGANPSSFAPENINRSITGANPTARPSVAQGIIDGVRPEATATGMPYSSQVAEGAKYNAIAALGGSLMSPADTISAQRALASKSYVDRSVSPTTPGNMGTAPTGPSNSTNLGTSLGQGGIGSDAVAGRTSTELGIQPGDGRYSPSLNAQVAMGIKDTSRVETAEMAGGLSTGHVGGIGSDAVAGGTSTELGTQPDAARYGGGTPNAPATSNKSGIFGFGESLNNQISKGISQTSMVENAQMSPGGVYSGIAKPSDLGQPAPGAQSAAKSVISGVNPSMKTTAEELASMSPAKAATMGLVTRTAAEQAAIGKMVAGELDPRTLSNLTSPNAEVRALARTEFANMVTTVENRAQSLTYNGIAETLNPSQYNSLMTTPLNNGTIPMNNTVENFAKYGTVISQTMADYYAGILSPTDFGLTNYHASAMANPPSWAAKMTNMQQVGYHTFGSLPEYGPNSMFQATRQGLASAYNQTNRGWTPSFGGVDTSPGSMAAGRISDRNSVYGHSGGIMGAGSMAAGRTADRASVSGYTSPGYTGGGPTSGPSGIGGGGRTSSGGYTGGGPTSGPSSSGSTSSGSKSSGGYTGGGPTSGPSSGIGGMGNTSTSGPTGGRLGGPV